MKAQKLIYKIVMKIIYISNTKEKLLLQNNHMFQYQIELIIFMIKTIRNGFQIKIIFLLMM